MLRPVLLGLLLLSACACPTPRTESKSRPAPATQAPRAPIDQLLRNIREDRPLIAGPTNSGVKNPTSLVRPLSERQLDKLLDLGHERERIQSLFVPDAGNHPAHAELWAGLRQLQIASPSQAQAEFIHSLEQPPSWRRAEELSAQIRAGKVQVSVSHWDVPILSLARAMRSTGGQAQGPTRALLEAALRLLD